MSLPQTMRHIDHGSGGGPEALRVAQAPLPVPGPGEALIRVAWAGVNRPDVAQRSGSYPPPPDASPVIGLEVAGRVAAVGEGVTQWRVGDAVCALTPGGGYAEYCKAPAGHLLPIPRGLDALRAAALPENYFTVWANVFERARLAPGESILVHGGSSGIGITAIQLAKAHGATVLCTVGNEDKRARCLALGADHAFDYKAQDFVEETLRATAKRGVDVVLDMVGGPYFQRNLKVLALEGRLSQIAFLQGSKGEFDLMPVMIKRLTFTGSTLRARPVAEKTRLAHALLERVWPLLEAGRALPVIHRVFPLAEAAEAHRLMESSTHVGKIMLEVDPSAMD
jgi:putative PIG3 family NAD(P)H quinone oxidoreductase